MPRLTNKQKVFVEYYLQTWNATESARLAGYKGNNVTLSAVGYENLRKPHIKSHIQNRLTELIMNSDEVLRRLSDQATASISDFAKPIGNVFIVDMEKVRAKGHLIKKIKYTSQGVEIELYNSQRALELMGKHHQLFTDKLKVEDWRSEIVQLLKDGRLEHQDVIDEFGSDLANELFVSAGVTLSESGETNT